MLVVVKLTISQIQMVGGGIVNRRKYQMVEVSNRRFCQISRFSKICVLTLAFEIGRTHGENLGFTLHNSISRQIIGKMQSKQGLNNSISRQIIGKMLSKRS